MVRQATVTEMPASLRIRAVGLTTFSHGTTLKELLYLLDDETSAEKKYPEKCQLLVSHLTLW